jgi:hypothetical protein
MKITILSMFILFLVGCSNFRFDNAMSFGWNDGQEQNSSSVEIKQEEKKIEGNVI